MVDFELPFIRALLLVDSNARVVVNVKKTAGYQASASLKNDVLFVKISDAFLAASQEVIDGMAFSMTFRMLRRKPIPAVAKAISAYKEFMSRESVARHNEALRKERGRRRKVARGTVYNLDELLRKISVKYWNVFEPIESLPAISYSSAGSKRRLGYYDSAHCMIFISSIFDDARVPKHAVENIVFHELLHAKHDVKYQRGKSMRRCVHTAEFKADERKYEFHTQGEEWLKKNLRKI